MNYIDKNGTVYNDIKIGPRGGKYYVRPDGKKIYIREKQKSNKKLHNSKGNTGYSQARRNSGDDKIRTCCCCGKPLKRSDCEFYDLTDYCPRCALADGIISSLE